MKGRSKGEAPGRGRGPGKGRGRLIALAATAVAVLYLVRRAARHRQEGEQGTRRHLRGLPRGLRRGARYAAGRAHGVAHELALRTHLEQHEAPADDNTSIKQRIESVLGHQRDLPLGALNFDVADAIVHVRGVVPDAETAGRVLVMTRNVEGVLGCISLMHTADGRPVGGVIGEVPERPRVFDLGEETLRRLRERWPSMSEFEVLDSGGHPDRLAAAIAHHSGEPIEVVREALDELLLQAV